MTKIGVMICGHGSRSQAAVDEFAVLAEKLPPLLPPEWEVDYGYLEFANPVIRAGLDRLRDKGCERILAVPGMLFAAMHAKNDIPTVLNTYAAEHGIEVSYGRELGVDPKMVAAAGARIRAAVAEADARSGPVPLEETCLVVIGRGASDPDANGNVAKIARLLHEGLGFGWCEVGYSGVTFPLVEPCLQHAVKLGYRRIVVFPYFLFTGILIDRIYGFTDRVAAAHPGIEFVKAGYLNDHPKVLETFAERVREQMGAIAPPNCGTCLFREQILSTGETGHTHVTPAERRALAEARDKGHPALGPVPPQTCVMCKYRVEVLGFEAELGAPQESHHHHVEGQGASAPGSNVADCTLCDTFCTGACRLEMPWHHHHHGHGHDHGHGDGHGHHHHHHGHDHDHAHAEYPHAKHPHGPESARPK
ncbi:MAG: sirohydrochlorin chelatase [Pseudooceanicola nanhaiensis]|uniref:sirohydrochlorin chelatase n=1 Tax=Pseudooceanicola nanhaiensis TaxID=375761 RepID=UPI0040591FDE